MAHQIDFHITLWSDNEGALLHLEQWLLDLGNEPQDGRRAITLAARLEEYASVLTNVDVHSVDINWDDNDKLILPSARLQKLLSGQVHALRTMDSTTAKQFLDELFDAQYVQGDSEMDKKATQGQLLTNLRIEDVPAFEQAAAELGFATRTQAAYWPSGWPMAGYRAIITYTNECHGPLWARFKELKEAA